MSEPAWEVCPTATHPAPAGACGTLRAGHLGPGTVTDVFIDTSRVTLRGDGLSSDRVVTGAPARTGSRRCRRWPGDGCDPARDPLARHQWAGFYVRLREPIPRRRPAISGIPPQPGMSVALLDDLAATGTSLLTCCEVVQGLGATVVSLYALVDREQGTRERFAAHGLRYRPLITLSELV